MDFAARLAAVKAAHLYRTPYLMESAQGREVVMDGRRVLLFCSNSYLGLNNRPEILRAAVRAVDAYGVGAGGSRLVSGNMRPHVRLENLLARFKGSEARPVVQQRLYGQCGRHQRSVRRRKPYLQRRPQPRQHH